MSKRDEFVAVAQSQVGVTEKGVNNVKYNTWYYGHECNGRPGTSEYAWCVVFESWCANEVGILNTLVPKCNNVGVLRDWYKERGLYHSSNYTPKKGDLVIFQNYAHTGIVEYVDNQVHTIEGNCGNKVARRTYDVWGKIIGYCEVKFGDEPTPTPTNKIAEDGLWGVATTRKAQKVFGTTVDGIVSNQYQSIGNKNPGLLSSTFQWESNPRYGSDLIRAIQNKVGTTADGYIGSNTIKAMQRWLRTPVDGFASKPSAMVKAFQHWLNEVD